MRSKPGRQKRPPIENLDTYQGKFLTPGQLAEYFGVRQDSITRWIRRGHLHAVRPGGHDWRIPIDAALALEQQLFVPRGTKHDNSDKSMVGNCEAEPDVPS